MFDTNPKLLSKLLDDVESAEMQLPDFQRGWVWDDDRIRALLASISRGFPIGAVMTLEAGGDIRLKSRPVEGVEANGETPDSYLLDGQQRLTSLYQALRHSEAVSTSDRSRGQKVRRWYYVDMQAALSGSVDREDAIVGIPEAKVLTEDFGRRIVLDLTTTEKEYEQHLMPTERLLDSGRWLRNYARHWHNSGEEHPFGDADDFVDTYDKEIIENFSNYLVPVIELGKETPKEAVCTVFEKVNTGGVALNVFELATASFAVDDSFSLRDDWAERRNRLYSNWSVLQGFQGDQFLQVIALLKTQGDRQRASQEGKTGNQLPGVGCRKRDILNLNLGDYQAWAGKVEEGLAEAAKFLRSQYVFGRWNVPYNTQLVPLAALFVELGADANTAPARERIERWYWAGVFGQLYGGAVETQFARDLVDVAAYVRVGTVPNTMSQADFNAQRLIGLKTRNSAAYKGVYAIQMKNQAADWMKGEPLSFATFDDSNIDIHHIFPVAWCQGQKIPRDLYDSIINKTPVDAHTNKVMGGRAPSSYLGRLRDSVNDGKLEELLDSHWLDIRNLEEDDFRTSFIQRGQKMLELIGNAMGRDLGDGRQVIEAALDNAGILREFIDEDPDFDAIGESEREEPDAA